MVAALLTRKDKAMNIGRTIQALVESERDAWITDHGDMGEVMRAEIAILERIMGSAKASIAALEHMAIEEGLAAKRVDPNFKPSELAPTKDMYIELHGQAAFDKVKRLSQPQPKFTWIA